MENNDIENIENIENVDKVEDVNNNIDNGEKVEKNDNKKVKMTRQEYNKMYYTQNKKQIVEKVLQVCHCEICGCTISKQHKKRHQLTNICKKRALMQIQK